MERRPPLTSVTLGPTGETFRENLRRVRQQRGWTLKELSQKLAENEYPIAQSALSKIENGTRRVDVDDAIALAVVLGVGPLALLLPDARLPVDLVELSGWGKVLAEQAWMWGASAVPLVLDGSVEDMEFDAHTAHRSSVPWWLDAPYVRVFDMTAQMQKVRLGLHDEDQSEREDDGVDQAAP